MIKKLSLIVAALSLAGAAKAADSSMTANMSFASEYVFRGIEAANNSFQNSVEFQVSDLKAGVWTNQPITKHENNEIDFYASWSKDVTPRLKFETIGTYYFYPEASRSLGQTHHSDEIGVGLTYKLGGFSPNVYYYHDFRLKADTVIGAIGYSLPLAAIGSSVDTSFSAGNVKFEDGSPDAAGPAFKDSYSYWGADVTVPFKLRPNATLAFGLHYTNLENLSFSGGPTGTVGKANLWFTGGFSIGF